MTQLLKTTIPIDLANGNNGRGNSFWHSAKLREQYEAQLRVCGFRREPFDKPVALTITRILGPRQRLWDADSVLRGSAKELVDSLVAVGWFVDDGPKWIRSAVGLQDASRRGDGPAVEIVVSEAS